MSKLFMFSPGPNLSTPRLPVSAKVEAAAGNVAGTMPPQQALSKLRTESEGNRDLWLCAARALSRGWYLRCKAGKTSLANASNKAEKLFTSFGGVSRCLLRLQRRVFFQRTVTACRLGAFLGFLGRPGMPCQASRGISHRRQRSAWSAAIAWDGLVLMQEELDAAGRTLALNSDFSTCRHGTAVALARGHLKCYVSVLRA